MFKKNFTYDRNKIQRLAHANFAILKDDVDYYSDAESRKSPALVLGLETSFSTYARNDMNNGWETAIRALYADIQKSNRNRITWSYKQLEYYIWNTRLFVSLIAHAGKLCQWADTYKGDNHSVPEAIFQAARQDYESWSRNLANAEVNLGIWLARVNAMNLPPLDLYQRTRWMFENTFADSNISKKTYLVYTVPEPTVTFPRSFVYYDSDGHSQNYTFSGNAVELQTYEEFTEEVYEMFNDFYNSEVFTRMSGDIRYAFGNCPVFPDDYAAKMCKSKPEPVMDETQLAEFQNATIFNIKYFSEVDSAPQTIEFQVGLNDDDFSTSLFNTNSTIVGAQSFKGDSTFMRTIINAYKDDPTPEEIVAMTRLVPDMQLGDATSPANQILTLESCGTEVITGCKIWSYSANHGLVRWDVPRYVGFRINAGTATLLEYNNFVGNLLPLLSGVDYHPLVATGEGTAVPDQDYDDLSNTNVPFLDVANFAAPSGNDMKSYHAIATMSLLTATKEANGAYEKKKDYQEHKKKSDGKKGKDEGPKEERK